MNNKERAHEARETDRAAGNVFVWLGLALAGPLLWVGIGAVVYLLAHWLSKAGLQ